MQRFDYYKEINGEMYGFDFSENYEDFKKSEFAKISYSMWIEPETSQTSLRITVPEEYEGLPVSAVGVHYSFFSVNFQQSFFSGNFQPGQYIPTVEYIYLPASVRHVHFSTSARLSPGIYNVEDERISVLSGCRVEISPENPYLCVYKNGIYSKDMKTLFYIFSPPEYDDECFEVPEGVELINEDAGSALKGLRGLVIPESVRVIEAGAFLGCPDLERADIRAEIIKQEAFESCKSLRTIRLDCKEAEPEAFAHCRALETIEISGICRLGKEAFRFCDSLREITLPEHHPLYRVYGHGLYSWDMTELHYLFETGDSFEIPPEVKRIKPYAGSTLHGLRRLVVPGTVEVTEERAFHGCTGLEEAEVRTGTIGDYAFYKCKDLLGAKLYCREIGKHAFSKCPSLKTAELLHAEKIDDYAFSDCKQLAEVRLPDTLRVMGNYLFSSTAIERLRVPTSVQKMGNSGLDSRAVLELYLKDGALTVSCARQMPADIGVRLAALSPETDEKLFEFVILGKINSVFTKQGVDFTKYDEIFRLERDPYRYRYEKWLFSAALMRLRCPYTLDEETRGAINAFIVKEALTAIENAIYYSQSLDWEFWDKELLGFISDKDILKLIDKSAEAGMAEITAVLMQHLHERKKDDV